jgi:hypothetical protein
MIGSELFVKRLYGAVRLGKTKFLNPSHFVNSIEFPFGITPEMMGSNPPPISQQHDQRKLIVFFPPFGSVWSVFLMQQHLSSMYCCRVAIS